ncbi:MAG: DUF433 domain-containing protein [Saprospiraceae bacterium]|nr:DUF433 domain-containing protein [Saprospiraceae bacterium]
MQEAEAILRKLTPSEKAQLISRAVSETPNSFPGIEKTPGVCGGDAVIIRTRIPVWLLVNWQKLGLTDAQLLEEYPTLIQQDLNNAWAYFAAFQEEIENNILENEQA